ncbi:MAG: YidB family protein [Methylococcales bacterium]|nr:YidB family protein [Methylococcales bacterium]
MEILNKIAEQFLTDANADGKIDVADAVNSLQTLLADASGKVDFSGMITKLQSTDLSAAVSSWLGNGENSVLSAESISKVFDAEKLNQFAASLNIDIETAKNALANAVPNLIDQVSNGGQLMEKFNDSIASLQEDVSEVAASANAQAGGILAKIKQLFS